MLVRALFRRWLRVYDTLRLGQLLDALVVHVRLDHICALVFPRLPLHVCHPVQPPHRLLRRLLVVVEQRCDCHALGFVFFTTAEMSVFTLCCASCHLRTRRSRLACHCIFGSGLKNLCCCCFLLPNDGSSAAHGAPIFAMFLLSANPGAARQPDIHNPQGGLGGGGKGS
tara:strand:- start:62 stop:568 length:507 start_codon:yes stop_codon:yes gene_type:complete